MNDRLERCARLQPSLFAFGTAPLPVLSAQEERTAPFQQRLMSCWCYLARKVRRYAATFTERERASFDAEDLMHEVIGALIERDSYWDPARGRYCTFADRVARSILSRKREQARVVHAPHSALAQLSQARDREARGESLGEVRRATLAKIARTFGTTEVCSPSLLQPERAAAAAPPRELIEALKGLKNPMQALVLARTGGLFGAPARTTREVAAELGLDPVRVARIQAGARKALRRRLEELRGA